MLVAALVGPWFVNWNDFRASFEQQATRILGHPVHVLGVARASILPSPSLTFTDVEVGDPGKPLMTVDRFAVTVELMALFQGQIHVVSMALDEPSVRVSVDDHGTVDWLQRATSADRIAPDDVALADVEIRDGSLQYVDASTGVTLSFAGIRASVAASSLAGPWHIDGNYLDGGKPVRFHVASGRQLADGTIRVKTDLTPVQWPVAVSVDGVLAMSADAGVTYTGTYDVEQAVPSSDPNAPAPAADADGTGQQTSGWRSQGSFALARTHVVIDKAVVSDGPPDRPTSVAGSLTLNFGKQPSFDATVEAKQIDLDRTLGGGPTAPVNVADAAEHLVAMLGSLAAPAIPGRVAFSVPAIVVGGSVLQGIAFTAATTPGGWQIGGLTAQLPGQASLSADGRLTTARQVSFTGAAHFAVAQPAVFAAWWSGATPAPTSVPLAAFDIAGNTEIAADRVSITNAKAEIGDSNISGSFAWGETREKRRELSTDLKADRIDFDHVRALSELLTGADVANAGTLADSFAVRLSAGAFQYDDVTAKDVVIDAGYADDVLKVVQIGVGDLGGVSFRVTGGRIDGLTTPAPQGHLEARLEAPAFDGLASIATKLAPDSGVAKWLGRNAAALGPAFANVRILAPPAGGATGFSVALDGVAGPTTFRAALRSAAKPADWWSGTGKASVVLDSPDSAGLARQFGLVAAAPDADSGAHVEIDAAGAPKSGLDATIDGNFAGLATKASGRLSLDAGWQPMFEGSFIASADDIAPLIATAGLAIPGIGDGTKLALQGTASAGSAGVALAWKNGTIGDRAVSGSAKLAPAADGWRLDGNLAVDEADLGWLAALSLGSAPAPTGNPKAPWAKTPFAAPTYGRLSGALSVAADHLALGTIDIANAKLALAIQPQRIDVDVTGGDLAGGKASGGVSIQNGDGDANLTGQLNLTGAALDQFVWQSDGGPVATGTFDLSANFEATGRSPAALVSSMTGGGTVAFHNGLARYVNPNAAALIVRVSDLGEQYSDEALKAAVEAQIDADSLPFADAGGAFSVAAGSVRLDDLIVHGANVAAQGDTTIDLSALTLDSDWTLTFNTGGAEGIDPKIGIVFRGPLAAPARTIDAVQFSSYLSTRQASRMLQIIAMEDADHLERERFAREILKFRQDAARTVRDAAAAVAAEQQRSVAAQSAMAALARLHVAMEFAIDDRAAAAMTRAATLAAEARDAAAEAATAAASRATDAHARADAAATALTSAVNADTSAAAMAAKAAGDLAVAQSAAAGAADAAAKAGAAADAADVRAKAAQAAEDAANNAAGEAARNTQAASDRLDAASAKAAAAKQAADTAVADAAAADDALDAAGKAVSDAFSARDAAQATLAAATADLSRAQEAADDSTTRAAAAAQDATTSDAERARLALLAGNAATAATAAAVERDSARQDFEAAEATSASAHADLDEAQKSDPDGVDAVAKKAKADSAGQALQIAQNAYEAAETKAADAAGASSAAQAAAEAAASAATAAQAAATDAAAGRATALAVLDDKTKAHDAALQDAEARADAARKGRRRLRRCAGERARRRRPGDEHQRRCESGGGRTVGRDPRECGVDRRHHRLRPAAGIVGPLHRRRRRGRRPREVRRREGRRRRCRQCPGRRGQRPRCRGRRRRRRAQRPPRRGEDRRRYSGRRRKGRCRCRRRRGDRPPARRRSRRRRGACRRGNRRRRRPEARRRPAAAPEAAEDRAGCAGRRPAAAHHADAAVGLSARPCDTSRGWRCGWRRRGCSRRAARGRWPPPVRRR